MTNTMPKTVTVTRTFTYDVANWIAQYELELADGGGQHPHNHNEYDVRYIIPTLDTTNREDVIEWITDDATSAMGYYVSATDNDITVTVGE